MNLSELIYFHWLKQISRISDNTSRFIVNVYRVKIRASQKKTVHTVFPNELSKIEPEFFFLSRSYTKQRYSIQIEKSFFIDESHESSMWKTFSRKAQQMARRNLQCQSRGLFQFWFIAVPSRGDGTIHEVFFEGAKWKGGLMNLWENKTF